MINFDLRNKKAIVTGAASGIGLATATRLARCGASVAMNDLGTNEKLGAEVARLKGEGLEVYSAPGDVSQPESAAQIVSSALNLLGGLDYLINNAGAPGTKLPIPVDDFDALTPAFWKKMLDVNLLSAFWTTKAARSALVERHGSVVNTVSASAFACNGSSTAYACAKAGLVHLTRHLAKALAPRVRVNGIAPGMVNSPWECSFGDQEEYARTAVPLQRVGQPDEYAELIAFLAAGSPYITGQIVVADGGVQLLE
ncbi:MAG: SDR family oxidoreductase [Mesorhizobium sp.]|uniref:SDR family NAD(P)-dependent oxidoreductase n=1 Tax=Mesorhizobium sp. TaxID=1871066 RepID=UPI000FE469CD|nr:SDR family oxidoreductase [Mesorhizobium sp.]RWM46173.1 MAG: SDR family oxidoreductase [Mesorhizobium sp.]RWM88992.1 MAG: SDR family oxidoreductase [Mesorhizobium sp.]TIM81881.1 MAG: SDR family oxidoreductase [Mesorhizobium sp.]